MTKSLWFEPATGIIRTDDPGDGSIHANYRVSVDVRQRLTGFVVNDISMHWLRAMERKHAKEVHGDTPSELPKSATNTQGKHVR